MNRAANFVVFDLKVKVFLRLFWERSDRHHYRRISNALQASRKKIANDIKPSIRNSEARSQLRPRVYISHQTYSPESLRLRHSSRSLFTSATERLSLFALMKSQTTRSAANISKSLSQPRKRSTKRVLTADESSWSEPRRCARSSPQR